VEEEVETSEEFDSALDDSDDEQSEEKDRFVAQLYKYMDERGTPINRAPSVGGRDLNLYKLYRIVVKMGGYNRVTNKNSWRAVYGKLGLPGGHSAPGKESSAVYQLKAAYKKFLHSFDDFYRKLGCTITVNSRTSRPSRGERSRGGGPVEDKPAPQSTPVAVSSTSSSSAKKSSKREPKKEDNTKEDRDSKEKDSVAAGALDSLSVSNTTPSKTKDRQSERERERESAREEARDDAKAAKESAAAVKEEVRVKAEEPSTPSEERKRGRGRKRKGDDKEDEPQTPAAATPTPAVVAKAEPAQVADEDTMTGQSTLDESDEEDTKSLSKGGKSVDESNIKVGDGLKVKYGRGRQLKVYEAKVLKVEVDASTGRNKYFVHYSGWNSRYDEWIKKSRIVNVLRDRSPSRRRTATGGSSKAVTKKGREQKETTPSTPATTAATGSQSSSQSSSAGNTTPATTTPTTGKSAVESVPPLVGPPVLTSQSSVSSTHSNDSALDGSVASSTATAAVSSQSPGKQSQTTPAPKRGRPPNSGKSAAKVEVTVKEEPKSQSDKHLQQSPQSSAATAPTAQTPTPSTPVGRRGRPPLSVKKEKFTRSKSVNEDQSTNDSMATSVSNAEDVAPTVAPTVAKTTGDESKKSAKQQLLATAGGDESNKSEAKAVPEVTAAKSTRGVQPPDLHDDNTVESKLMDETEGTTDESSAADHHRHHQQQQHKRGHPLDERLGAVIKTEPLGDECLPKATPKGHAVESTAVRSAETVDTKPEPKSGSGTDDFSSPVKDAFDFDDDEEELAKEEEPLKEQLKKKRKSKDSGSRSAAKSSSHVSERSGDRSAKESATGDETTDTGREGSARSGGSLARKSSKKTRKLASESSSSTAATDKSSPDESTAEDVKPMKAVAAAVIVSTPELVATVEDKRAKQSAKSVSTPTTRPEPDVQHSSPVSSKSEPKKRKGRKRKDEEEVSPPPSVVATPVSAAAVVAPPLKKRQINKPSKLDLSHEEDSNLEVQKLFEQSVPAYGSGGVGVGHHHQHSHQPVGQLSTSSSTPPQRHESADVSPIDDMKVLPNFTKDIHPTTATTATAINAGVIIGAATAAGAQHQPPADPLAAAATDFLLCEEAVPASPEKCPHPDDHPLVMDTDSQSSPAQHSSPYHSTPTQSPEAVTGKDGSHKLGSGSNSEMENETPMMGGISSGKDDDHRHNNSKANVSMPSPAHDEDSMVSRPDCNKSPVSPKKRRRGRVRTTSQSESSHTKERIGCKTRGSTGRHRADRHSPLTALEHRLPFSMSQISFNDFVPECKYNFCAPLDQSADPDRRICILQERLQELRKTYVNIKNEVSILDRKKKKARRKERERKEANGRHSAGVGAGHMGADHHMGRGMGSGADLTNTTCAITAATATLRATGAAAHHSSAHLSAAAAVAALATCSGAGAGGPYVS
ncbi:unnamed protein product, partial [Medioppia subpectinata]